MNPLKTNKADYIEDISEEYEEIREEYLDSLSDRVYLPIDAARKQKFSIDFHAQPPVKPKQLGLQV